MPLDDAAKDGKLEPEALNETNMLELYVFASEKHRQAVLVARLDNLGKGASGAAVQNMRLMLGLAETSKPTQVLSGGLVDDETLQFYRRNAEAYAQREFTSRQARLTVFSQPLPSGAAILELGCGAGGDSAEMLARGFDVSPTDGSPELAEFASQRLGRPVETLLFHDLDEVDAYEGVWANACLLHVPKPELAHVLALIWRALKPGVGSNRPPPPTRSSRPPASTSARSAR